MESELLHTINWFPLTAHSFWPSESNSEWSKTNKTLHCCLPRYARIASINMNSYAFITLRCNCYFPRHSSRLHTTISTTTIANHWFGYLICACWWLITNLNQKWDNFLFFTSHHCCVVSVMWCVCSSWPLASHQAIQFRSLSLCVYRQRYFLSRIVCMHCAYACCRRWIDRMSALK